MNIEDLLPRLLTKNITFFLGAGCSADAPSCFPLAPALSRRIAALEVGGDDDARIAARYGTAWPNLEDVAAHVAAA